MSEKELCAICTPVSRSFQKIPASCETVLLIIWQWLAHVQLEVTKEKWFYCNILKVQKIACWGSEQLLGLLALMLYTP